MLLLALTLIVSTPPLRAEGKSRTHVRTVIWDVTPCWVVVLLFGMLNNSLPRLFIYTVILVQF
jgi:hypothetical protein